MKKQLLFLLLLATSAVFCQSPVTKSELISAYQLYQSGDYDNAIVKFEELKERVSEKDSLYPMILSIKLELDKKTYDYSGAIKDTEELQRLYPDEDKQQFYTELALINKYIGNYDESIAYSKKIIEEYPDDTIVYANLAGSYIDEGKYEEAIKVLDSNPNKDRFALDYFKYATAYFELKNYASARQYIKKLFETGILEEEGFKDYYEAYKLAANIYNALGEGQKACESISASQEIIEDNHLTENLDMLPEKAKSLDLVKSRKKDMEQVALLKKQYCP